MTRSNISGVAALVLLTISAPLFGHHGTATSYDQNKIVKVNGTVKEFLWRNPHSALFLEGKNEAGKAVTYSLEMGSPNTLAKLGFSRNVFKPGDVVTLEAHPSLSNPTSFESISSRPIVINGKPLRSNNSGGN